MLYCLPLEPMEERYTEQWYRWFGEACEDLEVPCTYIDGVQLSADVEVGTVLDAAGTNYWKFTQMVGVCKLFKDRKIRDGDVFFTMDMWHPGLEAIPYMAKLYDLDVKIAAFLHAGSYTREDFAGPMEPWARHFETGWAHICDTIFVGSEYHKWRFINARDADPRKICVVGNPVRVAEMPELNCEPRDNIIVFTNRWDNEKRPQDFLAMMELLWKFRQDFEVLVTTSRSKFRSNRPELVSAVAAVNFPITVRSGLSKWEYYEKLNKAKVFVTTSIEENFGYCLVEAMLMGVTPVARQGLSHDELAPDGCLFDSIDYGAELCNLFLDKPLPAPGLRARHMRLETVFTQIVGEIAR